MIRLQLFCFTASPPFALPPHHLTYLRLLPPTSIILVIIGFLWMLLKTLLRVSISIYWLHSESSSSFQNLLGGRICRRYFSHEESENKQLKQVKYIDECKIYISISPCKWRRQSQQRERMMFSWGSHEVCNVQCFIGSVWEVLIYFHDHVWSCNWFCYTLGGVPNIMAILTTWLIVYKNIWSL